MINYEDLKFALRDTLRRLEKKRLPLEDCLDKIIDLIQQFEKDAYKDLDELRDLKQILKGYAELKEKTLQHNREET